MSLQHLFVGLAQLSIKQTLPKSIQHLLSLFFSFQNERRKKATMILLDGLLENSMSWQENK